ncbi:MAG: hypothetical protein F6K17_17795 [Okeania sp. SIO3C4]|nr:hypothetical protein [Okeania sp. SIO3C4]
MNKILNVPYFSQRDNYRDSWRTCFSSAVAMALAYVKPNSISSDDEYLKKVFELGDTTEAWVHLEILRKEYDIKASFSQSANNKVLRDYIDNNIPIPCGILHKGARHEPRGGGHWLTVIGYEDDDSAPGGGWWVIHDPWGEISNDKGTYNNSPNQGKSEKYSYSLMNTRWTVDGASDGWAILFPLH